MHILRKNSTKAKNIQMFRKKEFNLNNFINDYYMDQNNAYMTVKVNDYSDIVSKYSVENYEWINKEFADHLELMAYYIPVEEPIVIEITGKKFTDEQKRIIEKVIKTYFGLKLGDTMLLLNANRNKYTILLIFGVLSFVMFYLLFMANIIATILEIGSLVFWFIMWSFADLAFLQRNNLKIDKLEAGQLSSAKVTFID
jgi:hypothetical protein